MGARRYFETTRGRIVAELRRRGGATAVDLARAFELSTNAVRQHVHELVAEGVVSEHPVRRGPTKPAVEFRLTAAASDLFPQRYDRLLNAVLREVRELHGDAGVEAVFEGITRRITERHTTELAALAPNARIEEVANLLRRQGVEVSVEALADGTVVLSEHGCPFAKSVAENPELCTVVHGLLGQAVPGGFRQTGSIAGGDRACRFEIDLSSQPVKDAVL